MTPGFPPSSTGFYVKLIKLNIKETRSTIPIVSYFPAPFNQNAKNIFLNLKFLQLVF